MATCTLHIAMFPWFAMGHITPFVQLSNKLAENGHKISFFIPTKTQNKVSHLNLHPHLLEFIPLNIKVEGLPDYVETTEDVISADHYPFLFKAYDFTQQQIESALRRLKPDFIFYDFSHWLPSLVKPLRIKSVWFSTTSAMAYTQIFSRRVAGKKRLTEAPEIYPGSSSVDLTPFVLKDLVQADIEFNGNLSAMDRVFSSMIDSEALCFPASRVIDGPFLDYFESHLNKPVLILGSILTQTSNAQLEVKWAEWLSCFEKGSVVYCAFGTECTLKKDQFEELLLGLELTGLPFLARLKAPKGVESVEEALPEGFKERVRGRGVVHGHRVQQQLILAHPSVGCFVSHCGYGSMSESLMADCQIVSIPQYGDQHFNSKFMSQGLKVSVEVERREDGWFSRESVRKAVKSVMDDGEEIRANRHKLSQLLLAEGCQSTYINNFINKLQDVRK
ncbi:anthocyanidin 3-O-glucoside 2'''-O-xylosyltransferase [Ranunculus cassubicifolius]